MLIDTYAGFSQIIVIKSRVLHPAIDSVAVRTEDLSQSVIHVANHSLLSTMITVYWSRLKVFRGLS